MDGSTANRDIIILTLSLHSLLIPRSRQGAQAHGDIMIME